jgi:uncharacterized membrane protein
MKILADIQPAGLSWVILVLGLLLLFGAAVILIYKDDALTHAMACMLMLGLVFIFLYLFSQQKHEVIATIEPGASYTEIESQYKLVKHIDDLYWLSPKNEEGE